MNIRKTNEAEEKRKALCREALALDRQKLLMRWPFIGGVMMRMELIPVRDDRLDTASTNGDSIFVDIDFYARLTPEQRLFVLAHEVWHCVLLHFARKGSRDRERFNVAADLEIHFTLLNEKFSEPWVLPHDDSWASLSAEEIYECLEQKEKEGQGMPYDSQGKSNENIGDNSSSFDKHIYKGEPQGEAEPEMGNAAGNSGDQQDATADEEDAAGCAGDQQDATAEEDAAGGAGAQQDAAAEEDAASGAGDQQDATADEEDAAGGAGDQQDAAAEEDAASGAGDQQDAAAEDDAVGGADGQQDAAAEEDAAGGAGDQQDAAAEEDAAGGAGDQQDAAAEEDAAGGAGAQQDAAGGSGDQQDAAAEEEAGNAGAQQDVAAGDCGDGAEADFVMDEDYAPVVSADAVERARSRAIASAQQVERVQGTLPAHIESLINRLKKPQLRWQELLKQFLTSCYGGNRRWLPPSRRHVWHNLYLPSMRTEALKAVVALDTSGSTMGDLGEFFSELTGLLKSFGKYELTILQCDAELQKIEHYTDAKLLPRKKPWEALGGGGTDFHPVFDYVAAHSAERPDVLVYFTDGFGSAPSHAPSYPVMWVLTHNGVKPCKWGAAVRFKKGGKNGNRE